MTYEEAIKTLKHCQYNGDCKKCKLYIDGESRCMDISNTLTHGAIFEHHDKYAWHDLRKNPSDLPTDYHQILVAFVDKDGKWTYGFDGGEIVAWRYIEPFEGDI